MSKTIDILKIIVLSLIIVILVGVLVYGLKNKINFNFTIKKAELIYDENINEDFEKINVETKSLDVKFVKSQSDEVNVKIYDKKNNDATVNVDNNTLNIVSKNESNCFGFCFNYKSEIVISLPEKDYDVIINGTSSDISSEINLGNVDIKLTSGDIKLNETNICNIKVKSGDVNINNVNKLDLESTSGDVKIGSINESLNIETKSGDININELNLNTNSKINVTSGDININKVLSNIYFDTKVKSGDVKIGNNDRHAEVELSINTISGDIRVNN